MRTNRLLTALVVLATACGFSLTTAAPALAAGCYATSCDGRDPQAMGCAGDAITKDSFSWDGTYFELRLSYNCHAVWARSSNSAYPCYGGFVGVFAYRDRGLTQYVGGQSEQQACYSTTWTRMESYSYWIHFCYRDYYRGIDYCRGPF
ncbi:DUF2690 domain-containing protein [Saccharothrix saharensis]|uniref:DUF2690 domain-containing protein n=1 Tax=Saccharothrix saharensis TaxID=571190 RepID=UPI0036A1B709